MHFHRNHVARKTSRDFTSGKVLKNLILFSIPMAIATLLQVLFNAADVAIVRRTRFVRSVFAYLLLGRARDDDL